MDYTLTLNVEPKDLEVINGASQKIALAKPVGNSAVDVIWLAFDPFESNSVQWSEEYWIYASTASVGKNGEKITKLSEVQPGPAMDGSGPIRSATTPPSVTLCRAAMSIRAPSPRLTRCPMAIYPALTFGLSQSAQDQPAD